MKKLPNSIIDMTLTSPPYDDLRNYKNTLNWNFDIFKNIANELYRITKNGGVIIWVVGDKTINGSETGTSFKQALYFKSIGFNIYDTMIYKKLNYAPLTHRRYEQEFEYMFCFSKGKPNTFNPIKIKTKNSGKTVKNASYYKTNNDETTVVKEYKVKDTKIKGNIFLYSVGRNRNIKHPAMFPKDLVKDMINTWTNKKDLVLDCFMGSGTSGVVAKELQRDFIGIEIVEDYYKLAKKRIYDF
jgi:site-specific DNA-methyltransferase (adenine-specific)